MVYQSSSADPRSSQLSLPPGFRFYPTDEELLVQYLCRKIAGYQFDLQIIADVDLYKFDPWDLPSKAIFGENEWYFFSPRDRKYPNGTRPNRLAGCGYWKATGTDKIITTSSLHRQHVGIKKSLVFYAGKAPKGTKTDWIMHEYKTISTSTPKLLINTTSSSNKLDDWVLCRIYKKSANGQKPSISNSLCPSSISCSSQCQDSSDWGSKYDSVNLDLNRLGSGDFNWATLARLTMPPNEAQFDQSQPWNKQQS